ncbi:MAG: hypothetical protein QM627_03010 [Luteolibacter sp.]
MRILIFTSGLAILGMGVVAQRLLERQEGLNFIQGTLTLGGALFICAMFMRVMKWHGMIAAGIVALLGASRGLTNLPGFFKYLGGDRPRGTAPILEVGIFVICAYLTIRVVRELLAERTRRMLAEDEKP